MNKYDIIEMHKKCFDLLIEHQLANSNFYFVPRRKNNKNRLDAGMYFIGNENYLQISFWDGMDKNEKVHNIAFVVTPKGTSSIELSATGDNGKSRNLSEIASLLQEKYGYHFDEAKDGKWFYYYPDDLFLDNLFQFVKREKQDIDAYLMEHPTSGIEMLSSEFNDKFVGRIIHNYKENSRKKVGSALVQPSEYVKEFKHNELSNELTAYLRNNGYLDVLAEDCYADITCKDDQGNFILYELKTSMTVRQAIREAIGQLLEYSHYRKERMVDQMIIVTRLAPTDEDRQYLGKLRDKYQLPLYYQRFAGISKGLSDLY